MKNDLSHLTLCEVEEDFSSHLSNLADIVSFLALSSTVLDGKEGSDSFGYFLLVNQVSMELKRLSSQPFLKNGKAYALSASHPQAEQEGE